jgi:hypothetical protein
LLLPVLWQHLWIYVNVPHGPPHTAGSSWSQWGCCESWSLLAYMLLKVTEHSCNNHSSNQFSFFFRVSRMASLFLLFSTSFSCSPMWYCIWDIYKLVIKSSFNSM